MSDTKKNTDQECDGKQGNGAVSRILDPKEHDLGGFSVRRALPSHGQRAVGPWVFFDHFGPTMLPPGEGINVRPHPHINLATVSYLFEGEILHRDSLGSVQAIRPGDINLMVAGRGITHSERERPETTSGERPLHGLQLWLALPERDEETDPAFYHYPTASIPALEVDGVALRVMMGSAYDVESPVRTFAETLYVEATVGPGQVLKLPESPELAVYVAGGELKIDDTTIREYTMAVIEPGSAPSIKATTRSRVAIIGGQSLGERFMEWNFVSSRRERIEQAKEDWQARRFPTIPGDDKEFIPLPE